MYFHSLYILTLKGESLLTVDKIRMSRKSITDYFRVVENENEPEKAGKARANFCSIT